MDQQTRTRFFMRRNDSNHPWSSDFFDFIGSALRMFRGTLTFCWDLIPFPGLSNTTCLVLSPMLAVLLFVVSNCPGQDGQEVVTTDAGVQFEGKVFSVQDIAESASFFDRYAPGTGIVLVDDGLRLVFLNPNHVLTPFGNSLRNEISFDIKQKVKTGGVGTGLINWIGPFDRYGHRRIKINEKSRGRMVVRNYVQGITKITPRYCILEMLDGNDTGPTKEWEMRIATSRVPKEVLRSVLYARIKNKDNASEFFDIAYFFQQAGDFDQARQELRQIETKAPDLKDRIRDSRIQMDQLEARQILNEVRFRLASGQNKLALALAKAIPKDGLAGEILAEFQELEEQATASTDKLDQSRRQISELINNIANVTDDEMVAIKRFQTELETELNLVNLPRLDAYLLLAEDASMTDQHKIALAISGWLLGSNNASENLAVVESLYAVRDLVREYLTEGTTNLRRSHILNELKQLETGSPKFLDAMIKQMKPIEPPEGLETYTGEHPIEFTIEIPGTQASPEPQKYICKAHLPAEYDPYRKYPLILSLPGNQSTDQNLNMWSGGYSESLSTGLDTNVRQGHAMRNGYIVVSVEWRQRGQAQWGYTSREHRIVLDALRKALRMFSVDSDRVYLSGNGVGGDGAYDIGISHPEHWAGILGFSGKFDKYVTIYRENKHVELPLYCVNGQKDYVSIRLMKSALNEKWMKSKGRIDATVVHYRGRVNEQFDEEIPHAFKWMRGHRRSWPDKSGFEFSCETIRPGDSYFWFFEMDGIPDQNIVLPEMFDRAKGVDETTISGRISAPNVFLLGPRNNRDGIDSTLWLSEEFADFSKKIEIKGRGRFKDFVYPSSQVLLDDVYRRADREHPYWGAVDCIEGKWEARN